jgi:hypothetical protein
MHSYSQNAQQKQGAGSARSKSLETGVEEFDMVWAKFDKPSTQKAPRKNLSRAICKLREILRTVAEKASRCLRARIAQTKHSVTGRTPSRGNQGCLTRLGPKIWPAALNRQTLAVAGDLARLRPKPRASAPEAPWAGFRKLYGQILQLYRTSDSQWRLPAYTFATVVRIINGFSMKSGGAQSTQSCSRPPLMSELG